MARTTLSREANLVAGFTVESLDLRPLYPNVSAFLLPDAYVVGSWDRVGCTYGFVEG